jgi:hypothetical protein
LLNVCIETNFKTFLFCLGKGSKLRFLRNESTVLARRRVKKNRKGEIDE